MVNLEFIGQLEPLGYGMWRWPFSKMEEGQFFTVLADHKPVGAVRQYAYSEGARLGKRFTVTTDGEVHTVTCETPAEQGGRTPAQIAAEKSIFEGSDGDKYLGVLVPPKDGARWAWPFGKMEPGEYFHVAHEDRHPERVRQLAAVRSNMLGIQLTVNANDPAKPGHARLEYVDVRKKAAVTDFTFDMANSTFERCYDTDLNKIDPWGLQPIPGHVLAGKKKRFDKEQLVAPRATSFIIRMPEFTFGVQLDKKGITMTGLEEGTTFREWTMQEAMS